MTHKLFQWVKMSKEIKITFIRAINSIIMLWDTFQRISAENIKTPDQIPNNQYINIKIQLKNSCCLDSCSGQIIQIPVKIERHGVCWLFYPVWFFRKIYYHLLAELCAYTWEWFGFMRNEVMLSYGVVSAVNMPSDDDTSDAKIPPSEWIIFVFANIHTSHRHPNNKTFYLSKTFILPTHSMCGYWRLLSSEKDFGCWNVKSMSASMSEWV